MPHKPKQKTAALQSEQHDNIRRILKTATPAGIRSAFSQLNLLKAGAEDVFSAEGEVALAFTTRILERLGATGEQLERERERVESTFRSG